MITFEKFDLSNDKVVNYQRALESINQILDPKINLSGNLANTAALLNYFLKDINWVGFYLVKKGRLEIGPFIGLPACTIIAFNKGVCGSAWAKKRTIIVPDVTKFKGHIACDSASKSEIVVPIVVNNSVVGVLDIDSHVLDNFDLKDKKYLEKLVKELEKLF